MMETMIKQKVDQIAECLFAKIQKQENESFGLYTGGFGVLLFLLYYSRYTQNEKHALMTETYAEKLLEQFTEKEKIHTYCSGFSGILYLFEFLRENDIIDLDVSNIQSSLDHYLLARMRQDIRKQNYDFLHGALGVGLYFLKRKTNPEYIHELINFLYYTAEKENDNQFFKWKSIVDHEKNLIGYNLSLSHGISSIIIFFARYVNSGIENDKIREILSGAVNYLLAQQKDFSKFGSFFPSSILVNTPETVSKSRLAWCYGDLGNGIALWQAGKVTDNKEWKERGLEILLQSTKRRTFEESFVMDAGICHGSAGIAMIFRRMFFETHRNEFRDASQFWLKESLEFSRFEDGLAGYKSFVKNEWVCDYSLLTGISGIGLTLLSYLYDDQQGWDELFLLT